MRRVFSPPCLLALMALFGPGVFWGCRNPEPYAPAGLVNLYEGPVTTYHRACSSCHGENGSEYSADFQTLSDAELAEKIEIMMNGPARLTAPEPEEIHAMTAYHRALRDGRLFLMVSNPAAVLEEGHRVLKGNVTPGAAVELRKEGQVLVATVSGGEWILENIPPPPFLLTARKDSLETAFPFPDKPFNGL
ncbi:MAG TPA: hypothetical protein PLX83_08390 [bacterium]|nr:hypothetical protein [bacterium]